MGEFEQAFALHIRARRIRLGLTLVTAAEAAGVSFQTWRSWESVSAMSRTPRLDQLPAIAGALRYKTVGGLLPKFESPKAFPKRRKARKKSAKKS